MTPKTPDAEVKEAIADSLDRRRTALTETSRVVTNLRDNVLQARACAMAVPMVYAVWEGYTKEVLQLYIEHLEGRSLKQREVKPAILAYAWTNSFKKLSGELTLERKVELIERFLASLTETLRFEKAQHEVDTKANLFFSVLEGLASCLCLDIDNMKPHEKKLDALVNRRNNIAHGGREQKLDETDVEEYIELVVALMGALETVLVDAVDGGHYRCQQGAMAGIPEKVPGT
jgi:hypothetical protein